MNNQEWLQSLSEKTLAAFLLRLKVIPSCDNFCAFAWNESKCKGRGCKEGIKQWLEAEHH